MPSRVLAVLAVALAVASVPTTVSLAEVGQKGDLRVSFSGKMSPKSLPRRGAAPIAISIGGKISTTDGTPPPQLQEIKIEINRHGRLSSRGLPVCRVQSIDPSTTAGALAACRASLIGEGHISANVELPEQSPFPSQGKILAFNGIYRGHPAILAHIYGTRPIPTSYVLPFLIRKAHGAYGTVLEASLPQVTGDWGFVTGISMTLSRRYSFRGHYHSYLSAGCPAPPGFPSAVFSLTRTSFAFANGQTLTLSLSRSCRVG